LRLERETPPASGLLKELLTTDQAVVIGRHADDKLKMQNAADSAAMTGGVMLARGLNGLAHTNHLLCEVFAITAYLREGNERNAEQQVPGILQAWGIAGGELLEVVRQMRQRVFLDTRRQVAQRLPFRNAVRLRIALLAQIP